MVGFAASLTTSVILQIWKSPIPVDPAVVVPMNTKSSIANAPVPVPRSCTGT